MRADMKGNKLFRTYVLIMLPLPSIAMICSHVDIKNILFIQAIWSVTMIAALASCPKVILTEKGIYSYILFKGKPYPWDRIIQAGILYRRGKNCWYNEFILLKQGGSPRKYKDKTFLIRNIGKTIHMDVTDEIHAYVLKHYGLLDFNLADGKKEQSQVDEELSKHIENLY